MNGLALPFALVLEVHNVSATAARAINGSVRPAEALHVLQSVVRIGEEKYGRL
jgi:hypothetical protein